MSKNNFQSNIFSRHELKELKQSYYNQNCKSIKDELVLIIKYSMKDLDFTLTLISKLKEVGLKIHNKENFRALSSVIVNKMLKKLSLLNSMNYKLKLQNKLVDLIDEIYKSFIIEITLHPSKIDVYKEIITLDFWPSYFVDSIIVIENPNVNLNFVSVKSNNIILDNESEIISNFVDKILLELKVVS